MKMNNDYEAMMDDIYEAICSGRAELVREEELPMTMALHKKRIGKIALFPNGFALVIFTNDRSDEE